jgi:hypothetical protein
MVVRHRSPNYSEAMEDPDTTLVDDDEEEKKLVFV